MVRPCSSSQPTSFHRAPCHSNSVHIRLKKPPPATALLFGAIKRQIGVLHQLNGMRAVARRQCNADAGANADFVAFQLEMLIDALNNAARQDRGFHRFRDPELEDRELVSTQAGNRVGFAHRRPQSGCDRAQQAVADRMPERVVDRLEPVEIEAK